MGEIYVVRSFFAPVTGGDYPSKRSGTGSLKISIAYNCDFLLMREIFSYKNKAEFLQENKNYADTRFSGYPL